MKKFKDYISENYDVYLDMPDTKKYKATVTMLNSEGKEENFPIGADDNIRAAAHKTVTGLKQKGYTLKNVEYHF